ncbi:MAG: hypothetical protein QXU11_05805 [Thermoproteota archaeon]
MGEHLFTICYKRREEAERDEMEKELHDIAFYHSVQFIDELYYGINKFEVMWQKKLRHLATILATAYDIKFSKQSGMKEVYDQLRLKVKVWVRNNPPWGYSDYIVRRAFWPCEILDLKEVQDEIGILTRGELLSKDNPEDREIVQQSIKWLDEKEKQMPIEKTIDEKIGFLNAYIRDIGTFLARSTEFHHKYPKKRFWFYVGFG